MREMTVRARLANEVNLDFLTTGLRGLALATQVVDMLTCGLGLGLGLGLGGEPTSYTRVHAREL
jgi:hypothetical protein